jgi:YggT family protein
MQAIWQVLSLLLYVFLILLVARLVLDYVRVFARQWQPRGPLLVVAEVVFTATDPPLRMIRRFLPPLTVGGLRIDLAFIVLFLITSTLMSVLRLL